MVLRDRVEANAACCLFICSRRITDKKLKKLKTEKFKCTQLDIKNLRILEQKLIGVSAFADEFVSTVQRFRFVSSNDVVFFPQRHNWHRFVVFEYDLACLRTDHLIS